MQRLLLRSFPLVMLLLVPLSGRTANNAVHDRILKDLEFLASEQCEGRGVETKGIQKAADYIAKTFQDNGFKPGGKDGSYFQPFTIGGARQLGGPNKLVVSGPLDQTFNLVLSKQFTVSGLSGTAKLKQPAVFVGHGITNADTKYDDYAGVDVAGKWVIVLRKTPRPDAAKDGFPDAARFAPLAYKIANAQEHKAAGIIFVNDRKTAEEEDTLMPFEYARDGGGGDLPIVQIERKLLNRMLFNARAESLSELEEKLDADLKPQSRTLPGWMIEGETAVNRKTIEAKNIIGVLEGNGPLANETVIIGGHYDHLGRGEVGSLAKGDDRKLIHYGADDNGSGTTGVLELARRLGAIKNRQGRRIVLMAFSGEERGLLGSRHYCEKDPIFPLDKTVAMINLDMIGRLRPDMAGKESLEVGGTGTADTFDKLIDRLNEKYKFSFKKSRGGLGPSDHASFYPKGVPVFFFFTGLHPQYHRPTDIPGTINVEGLAKIVDLTEELALELATVPERPKYLKVAGGLNPNVSRPAVPSIRFAPGNYDEAEEKGVLVGSVTADGPADKGGLKEGDFIVEIAGKTVKNMDGYMSAMSLQKRGQPVEFTIDRKGKKLKLTIVPQ